VSGKTSLTPAERRAYRQRLSGAVAYRARADRVDRWRSYIRILAHNFYSDSTLAADSPTINLIAARVRAQPPKLAFGIPSFSLTPYGPPPVPNSVPALEAALSLVWEQEGFDDVTRRVTLDWPAFGVGIGFLGFERGREGDIIDRKRKLFGLIGESVTEKAVARLGKGAEAFVKTDERRLRMMLKERLFLERVSPFNFVIDPCAEHWDDAQYMARRIALPWERARMMFGRDCPKTRTSNNVALYRSSADEASSETPDPALEALLPEAIKRVMVWESWDITSRRVTYHDEDYEVIGSYAFDWRSPHPGFPFVPLLWDEIPDVVWAEGLAAAIKPLNDELHLMRSRQLTELRKAYRKYRVDPAIERDALKALQSDEDGAIVRAEEGQIEALQHAHIPPEQFSVEKSVRQDIDEVTHTSAYDSASMPQIRRSATEAAFAQSSSDAVSAWRKTAVERFAAAVAERMLAYFFTVFDEPFPVRIANADENYFVTGQDGPRQAGAGEMIDYPFVGTEHAGAYRLKTVEDTMMSTAKDVERMQLAQAFQMFAGAPWFKDREAAAHFFSTMPSVRDPFRFIRSDDEMASAAQDPGPPPGAAPASSPFQNGEGSGNMTADLLAAAMGGQAPMTGDNGMGGADPRQGGVL